MENMPRDKDKTGDNKNKVLQKDNKNSVDVTSKQLRNLK